MDKGKPNPIVSGKGRKLVDCSDCVDDTPPTKKSKPSNRVSGKGRKICDCALCNTDTPPKKLSKPNPNNFHIPPNTVPTEQHNIACLGCFSQFASAIKPLFNSELANSDYYLVLANQIFYIGAVIVSDCLKRQNIKEADQAINEILEKINDGNSDSLSEHHA